MGNYPGNGQRVRVNLLWYDRDGNHVGTTANTDARFTDPDQLGMHPAPPDAAFVRVQLVIEGRRAS